MTKELDDRLMPFREAEAEVYRLSSALFALFDLDRLARSLWLKGISGAAGSDLVIDDQAASTQTQDLMLTEVYSWHQRGHLRQASPADFPIMIVADTFSYRTASPHPVFIDTYDLTITTATSRLKLPADSARDSAGAQKLWMEHVKSHYWNRLDREPRFLRREGFESLITLEQKHAI